MDSNTEGFSETQATIGLSSHEKNSCLLLAKRQLHGFENLLNYKKTSLVKEGELLVLLLILLFKRLTAINCNYRLSSRWEWQMHYSAAPSP